MGGKPRIKADSSDLVTDLRQRLQGLSGLTEKRMMGGHCFLLNGNMLGGAGCNESGESRIMMRVGKANADVADSMPGAEPLAKGGRRMGGMYLVDPAQPEVVIDAWLSLALNHARSLPPK